MEKSGTVGIRIPTIQNPEKFEILLYIKIANIKKQSRLMNHSKSGPFNIWTCLDFRSPLYSDHGLTFG